MDPDKWQTLNACFSDEPLTNYTMRMDFMFLDKDLKKKVDKKIDNRKNIIKNPLERFN